MTRAAQSRVFVDGNNVMGSRPDGWWRDRAGAARGDEGVGRLDAPELDLVGEVVRQILGAVIHPQGQPPSRAGRGRAIQPGKPHGDRLQGGEAVAALADMPADTLGGSES